MTRAYDEKYLDDAMQNLGEAVDYAVNSCGISTGKFFELFVATGIASQFAAGVPKFVSGMSGTELVHEVIEKSGLDMSMPTAQTEYDCSLAYWCGFIIAYYQWYTGMSFEGIFANISASEIEKLYPTLHEASEEKFVDTVNKIIARKNNSTNLQRLRKNCGLSQRELAEKAEVNLRTLQQYELGTKSINKAAVGTLSSLAKVLGCRIEDLMERTIQQTRSS